MMNAKKIVLYSGKGGVGKSPLVVELAARFARMGKRVLIVDLDAQSQATTGIGAEPTNALYDLVSARVANIRDNIQPTRLPNISILASGDMSNTAQSIAFTRHFQVTWLEQVLAQVAHEYDVIIIDTAQGGLFGEMAIAAADMIVSPVRCQYAHLEALIQTPATVAALRQTVGKPYPMTVVVPICGGDSVHARNMFDLLKSQIESHQPNPTNPTGLDNWALFTVDGNAVPLTVEIDNAKNLFQVTLLEYRPNHRVSKAYDVLASEIAAALGGE